jgi:hypothetical protein
VLVHEHGFHHITPALLTVQQAQLQAQSKEALHVCCCVFKDYGKTSLDRNSSHEGDANQGDANAGEATGSAGVADGSGGEASAEGSAGAPQVNAESHLVCGPLQQHDLERRAFEMTFAEDLFAAPGTIAASSSAEVAGGDGAGATDAVATNTGQQLTHFDAMVLMVEGGRSSWRGLWFTPLQRWFEAHACIHQAPATQQQQQPPAALVLVLLFESQKPAPAHELVEELLQIADRCGWDSTTERPAGPAADNKGKGKDGKPVKKVNGSGEINGLWSTGRRWVFVSCTFRFRGAGNAGASASDALAEAQTRWAEVRPEVN